MASNPLTLSSYKANFEDPRVKARVSAVLDFCKPMLFQKKAKPVSSASLTKAFGNQTTSLARFLRYKLLQQEGTYKPRRHSYSYTVKRDGYEELAATIGQAVLEDAEIARELYGTIASGDAAPTYTEPTKGARRYHPVQNLPKTLRADLFAGWFDYDIEAAAPTLVYQQACKVCQELKPGRQEKPYSSIARLVEDRERVRQHVSQVADVDLRVAKGIVVALFFGARLVPNEKQAIFRLLGGDQLSLARLKADSFVSTFRREVSSMWNLLLMDENRRNGLARLWGGPVVLKPSTKGKQKMGLYLRLERQVIDVIDGALRTGGVVPLLIHDGFMSRTRIEKERLEKLVKERTGFSIKLAEYQVGVQVDDTSETVSDEFGEAGELD